MYRRSEQNNTVIKAVTVALICFIFLLLVALMINLVRFAGLNNAEKDAKSKLNEAIAYSQSLEDTLDYKSSSEYIERYAREYLNMKRKGEKIFSGNG